MNKFIVILLVSLTVYTIYAYTNTSSSKSGESLDMSNINSIYQFKLNSADGKLIDFNDFRGKKILIVNTATECGFTYQLESLQKLQDKFVENLVVIGTPSNDFMNQEPRNNSEIINFCSDKYGVEFLLTEKIHVSGKKIHEIYKYLTNIEYNGTSNKKVSWNFNKFLIDENGYLLDHFGSMTKPFSEKIISLLR
ncbi:MAG: glutathione peroxidase [Candidatus Neomarinimicrobiota bacterium]|jgi:glutathione peroxidase|nr:glutathione peroxidase [Candidatus Neomarinimicrobiota bacterium]